LHQEILGKTLELVAMHAWPKGYVIGEKHPGMRAISVRPARGGSPPTVPATVCFNPA
jgi:hypothetical protein